MRWTNASRAGAAILLAGVLLGGVVLGTVIDAVGDASARQDAIPTSSAPTPPPTIAALPAADVPGEDFAALPRYPGAIRSSHELTGDDGYELIAAEYLVAATVTEVRVYYQGVIAEHGWERVDINYRDGEWAYVLMSGAEEALVEIEERDGLVEIDLQLSRPIGGEAPALPDALPATPAPPIAPPPPAPAPPPPADDDDDSDDGADDDSG